LRKKKVVGDLKKEATELQHLGTQGGVLSHHAEGIKKGGTVGQERL